MYRIRIAKFPNDFHFDVSNFEDVKNCLDFFYKHFDNGDIREIKITKQEKVNDHA